MAIDYEMLEFTNARLCRQWFDTHHASVDGVWLRMYKKASGIDSVVYAEALDIALCYGWIDGQRKKYDEVSYIQKFTPRRLRSLWSKRNIEHIERLNEAGLVMPQGVLEVERAKQDGRWDAAYDAPSNMVVPNVFLQELAKHPQAQAFFETLNKTNKYSIAWRLQTAKTEATRKRRQDKIINMLEAGETF